MVSNPSSDMVPYSWILNCLEMVGTAKNIINMAVSRFD